MRRGKVSELREFITFRQRPNLCGYYETKIWPLTDRGAECEIMQPSPYLICLLQQPLCCLFVHMGEYEKINTTLASR